MAAEQSIAERGTGENLENVTNPRNILLFSGKRKSGKDFVTNVLHERIGKKKSVILRISGPIKTHFAKSQGLDIDQLLSDGPYKEKYRLEMIHWGECMRKKDYGYFCRASIDMYNALSKPIWIVSDIRRKTDIQWFTENYGDRCKTVRIVCDNTIREQRGWVFTPGVDDSETECNLDDITTWDLKVQNNEEDIEPILEQTLALIR